MPRQTWLASELRAAGLNVVEVAGWRTRGSETFYPIGVQWHATAGSRNGTAAGEVRVILNGSTSAPPPIAQLMVWRDGTIYVCAAGRCNHNKVGWDGPNKGLGNTDLLGIEMANDNKGEAWSPEQMNAARLATAVIFRKIGTDPRQRLSGHYEHQPYATRPPGERSTKSDPYGVKMSNERATVATLLREGIMALSENDKTWILSNVPRAVWSFDPGWRDPDDRAKGVWPGVPGTHFGELGGNGTVAPSTALARILDYLVAERGEVPTPPIDATALAGVIASTVLAQLPAAQPVTRELLAGALVDALVTLASTPIPAS